MNEVCRKKGKGRTNNVRRFDLEMLRYHKEDKKLIIIFTDKKRKYDTFQLKDYSREYGDIMQIYFTSQSRKLKYTAKQIAELINTAEFFEKYVSIEFICVGAAGICMFYMLQYLKRRVCFVTIGTPFYGTALADKKYVYKNIPFIHRRRYNKTVKSYYLKGLELEGIRIYDELEEVLKRDDSHIIKRHRWIQFICESDENKDIITKKIFGEIPNDGIVPVSSQEVEFPRIERARKVPINATHEESLLKVLEYFEKEKRRHPRKGNRKPKKVP